MEDLIKKINDTMPKMSKGQKKIGGFIIDNFDKASTMTAARLGESVGISESTVVRFATELGFKGYPEFIKELEKYARPKLTSIQRMGISSEKSDMGALAAEVFNYDIEKIKRTRDNLSAIDFEKAVESIVNAENIYILSSRSSIAVADFLAFYLKLFFKNVHAVQSATIGEMFDQIVHVSNKDTVIGISFPRYSTRTVKAMKFASDRGATAIAITDDLNSPLAEHAKYTLTAQSGIISFIDSLTAPLSLVNALIVAVGIRKKEEVESSFRELERIWEEFEVYERF